MLRRSRKFVEINNKIFAKTNNANNINVKTLNKIEILNDNDYEIKIINITIKKRYNIFELFYSNNRNDVLIINFLNNLFRFYDFITKR